MVRRVIRRRRPNGRHHAQARVADASLLPLGCRRDRGGEPAGGHRQTLAQPRGRSAGHHPRHPVGRRLGRFRHGLGARRPGRAHAGRGRHHQQLQDHPQRGPCRRVAGNRLHRQGAPRRPAGRAGHLLPHPFPGPRVADDSRRAAGRTLSHRAERMALGLVRVVGRHRRRRLGHRRGARRHAQLRDDGAMPPRFLHPFRRPHLCRLPDRAAAATAGRRNLEQPRHRREVQGGADAGGLPRQLQIQPARFELAQVQCRGPAVRPVGRSRSHQRLVSGRAARMGRLSRQERAAARRARMPGLPRIHADARNAGGGRPHLPQDSLRPAARRLPARHALLSHRSATPIVRTRPAISSGRRRRPGSSAN